jgi:hypothetical protein
MDRSIIAEPTDQIGLGLLPVSLYAIHERAGLIIAVLERRFVNRDLAFWNDRWQGAVAEHRAPSSDETFGEVSLVVARSGLRWHAQVTRRAPVLETVG